MRAPRVAGLAALVVSALLLGCGDDGSSGPGLEGAPAVPTLPAVDAATRGPRDPGLVALVEQRSRRVREAPESAEAWGRLGLAFDAHSGFDGDFAEQAVACYARAAALAPDVFRWPYLAGSLTYVTDQRASVEWFDEALARDPATAEKHAPLFVRRGIGRLALGEIDGAARDFERATALDGELVQAWLGTARVALENDDPEDALEALARAETAGPDTDEIHGVRAEALRRLGRTGEAAGELERLEDGGLRESIPDRLRAEVAGEGVSVAWARSRAKTLRDLGRLEDAARTWQRVIERGDQVEAHLALADLYAGARRFADAEALLERIGERAMPPPERAAYEFERGVVALSQGREERASAAFEAALELDDEHHGARGNLGVLMFEGGDRARGLAMVRASAEELGPESSLYANYLKVLERAQLWPELEQALEEFIAGNGESGYTAFLRGRVLAEQSRFEGAAAAFHESARLEPNNERAVTNAARAERSLGREAVALRTLREGYVRIGAGATLIAKELAWNLSTVPEDALLDEDEALELARRVVQGAEEDPERLDVLAAAEAASGEFESAIEHAGAALEKVRAGALGRGPRVDKYTAEIEERLAAYRRGERWRRGR